MIRYRYNTQIEPPAPFLLVDVVFPGDPELGDWLPGQIDTGADSTVIPLSLVEKRGLLELDRIPVRGFGGGVRMASRFLVDLRIRGSAAAFKLAVIADADEPFVLVGRDILNRCRLRLDGPEGILEISLPEGRGRTSETSQ